MRALWALRSLVFVLWQVVTVVPWALLMLLLSMFVRGKALYWPTMRWLRMAIWGARVLWCLAANTTAAFSCSAPGRCCMPCTR